MNTDFISFKSQKTNVIKKIFIISLICITHYNAQSNSVVEKKSHSDHCSVQYIDVKEYDKSDTIRAIKNLFQRKRRGGIIRASVFGSISALYLFSNLGYSDEEIKEVDLASDFIIGGALGLYAITGIANQKKYGQKKLDILLKDYEDGKPIPYKITRKLKSKDFRFY